MRRGTYPSVPTDALQYITLGDYQSLAPVTPVSRFLPPSTTSAPSGGMRPVMVDLNGVELI